jgi:hypothetical protein
LKKAVKLVHDLINTIEKNGLDENRKYASTNSLNRENNAEQKKLYVWSNDYLYDLCFKLWLDGGVVLDSLGEADISYDLLTKVFCLEPP